MGRARDLANRAATSDASVIEAANSNLATVISGLTLTRTGTTTFSVGLGACTTVDATSTPASRRLSAVTAAISKTLSAWAVGGGNGALDTGAVANNTWYHVYLIRRDSDGLIDVLLSLSATAPTMPSGWTNRRRIGSIRTDGSAQIVPFVQSGNEFRWVTPPLDVNVANLGAARTLYPLTVPTGVQVRAQFRVRAANASAWGLLIQEPAETDAAPLTTGSPLVDFSATAGLNQYQNFERATDTSGQIAARSTVASTTLLITTLGWVDFRGQ